MKEGVSRREFLKVAGGAAVSALVSEDSDASEHLSRIEKEDIRKEQAVRDSLTKIHDYFLENTFIDETLDDGFAGETTSLELRVEAATELLEQYEGKLSGLAEMIIFQKGETKSPTYNSVLENDLLQIRNKVAEVFVLHNELRESQNIKPPLDPFAESNPTFQVLGLLDGDPILNFPEAERLGEELDPLLPEVTSIFTKVLEDIENEEGAFLGDAIVEPGSFPFRNHSIEQAEDCIRTGEVLAERINSYIKIIIGSIDGWARHGIQHIGEDQQENAKRSLEAFMEYSKKIAHATHLLAVPLKLHPNVGLPQELIEDAKKTKALLSLGRSI